jgi:3-dehydrotetronate 4-kinase
MPLLGCIADDFTGGTDLANNLAKTGFKTVQTFGVPAVVSPAHDADAVVVALKTRTRPVEDAKVQSSQALDWLRSLGCRQFYFKYCSTFDSTPRGNIGPVIDALLESLAENFTVACPAFPDNGRTLYRGHLFVNDALLNESGMQNHPLTPMTDANLVRVLAQQTPSRVGLIRFDRIAQGATVIAEEIKRLREAGVRIALVDTLSNEDLLTLGRAVNGLKLVTGGSGLAFGLGANFGLSGIASSPVRTVPGRRAILAGSCSMMTLRQLDYAQSLYPHLRLRVADLAKDFGRTVKSATSWAVEVGGGGKPILIFTSGTPAEVAMTQQQLSAAQAGTVCENALAEIALSLVDSGVTQLIVAGGETSGAVVKRLELETLQIGPEIDPGVPWTLAHGRNREIALVLKSGNFGSEDFFTKAWNLLK